VDKFSLSARSAVYLFIALFIGALWDM